MKLRTLACLLVSVGSIAFSPVFAAPAQQEDVGRSVITVADADNMKWAFASASRTMSAGWDHILKSLYPTILSALWGGNLSYLDQKFQLQKRELNMILEDRVFGVTLFADTTIDVVNDGTGSSYHFFFPKLDSEGLGITEEDNIRTPESASIAAEHLNKAIQAIDAFFPMDNSPSSLKAFISNKAGLKTSLKGGVININGSKNANTILDSLVEARSTFMLYFKYMLNMSKQVASGAVQGDDERFQDLKEDVKYLIEVMDVYGMKVFNGGSVTIETDNNSRTVDMPLVNAATFGLDNANLTNEKNLVSAYYGLVDGLNWMADWTITGKTPEMKKHSQYDLAKPVFSSLSKKERIDLIEKLAKKFKN